MTSYWEGGFRCRVPVREWEVRADEPPDIGSDTGPAPTELFLTSLATCFTMAMVYAARKRDVKLDDLAVRVESDYDGPRIRSLRVEVQSTSPHDEVEALLEPARRACYVSNTLAEPPELTYVLAE